MNLNPFKILKKIKNAKRYFRYLRDYRKFDGALFQSEGKKLKWSDRKIILGEDTSVTKFDAHYVYHPAWAARIIAKTKPEIHFDISSTLHFCSIVSAFTPVKFYDFRPVHLNLSNLSSEKADLLALPFNDGSVTSLSCMHTIEHLGLGRYGDPIEPNSDRKAANELKRVLATQGNLLIVVPVGKPKIMFNAHKIYSYEQVTALFSDLKLREFCLIPDNAALTGIIYNADPKLVEKQKYGCGCFWFIKSNNDNS